MNTITVGRLRQNPTEMLNDVASGATYSIIRHGREVGRIIPPSPLMGLIPPKRSGGASTAALPSIEPTGGMSVEELLEETRGDW